MCRTSIYISIPTPCHEDWHNMNATERGAFCHSCQKEVIDFSAMTDREIIAYLEKHQTGCGRFREDQLDTKLTIPKVENGVFRWRALMLGILPIISTKIFAQVPRAITEQYVVSHKVSKCDTIILPEVPVTAYYMKRERIIIGVTTTDTKPIPLPESKDTITITTQPEKKKNWFQRTFSIKHKRQ
jgi:hypothetical protein